jgi:proteasome lid subunit RPN8/RPN11
MIIIPKNIVESIINQAKNELPDEACGLLAGRGNTIFEHYPLTNTDHSPDHFSFDPHEQFAVLKKARKQDWEIVANYHSHPSTPARPSQEDVRLAYDPDIVYFILSLQNPHLPVLKAFRIQAGEVKELSIELR